MYCPRCGAYNPDDAKFCVNCGADLTTVKVSSPGTTSVEVGQMKYAGFWIRFVAAIIDGIILNIGYMIIAGILGISIGSMETIMSPEQLETHLAMLEIGYGLALIGSWLYYSLFQSSSWQATPGKRLLGLKVTDLAGNRISFARATARYFSKYISAFIFMIGFIMAGFTAKKQALHDIIAGTLVVKKN